MNDLNISKIYKNIIINTKIIYSLRNKYCIDWARRGDS
jgi:hypothetical protein